MESIYRNHPSPEELIEHDSYEKQYLCVHIVDATDAVTKTQNPAHILLLWKPFNQI